VEFTGRGDTSLLKPGAIPTLVWHDGNIMVTAQTAAIFWGSNWSNSNFVSDKITGLDSWYTGVGGSKYGATVDEFTGPQGTQVKDPISYLGHYVDTTPGPSRAPKTSTILAEVCKVIPVSQLASNGYPAHTPAIVPGIAPALVAEFLFSSHSFLIWMATPDVIRSQP